MPGFQDGPLISSVEPADNTDIYVLPAPGFPNGRRFGDETTEASDMPADTTSGFSLLGSFQDFSQLGSTFGSRDTNLRGDDPWFEFEPAPTGDAILDPFLDLLHAQILGTEPEAVAMPETVTAPAGFDPSELTFGDAEAIL